MPVAAPARRPRAPPFVDPLGYARHRPETTLLYQLVAQHFPAFRELREEAGRPLPDHVEEEFEAYLDCGRLEEGFLRLRCERCHAEKLVAFSCKKRGFCPSCGARRMAETAAMLADEVLPQQRLRQWVLSLPHPLRFLLATDPEALTWVLGVACRTISGYLIGKAGLTRATGDTGAVTFVQRFGSALNLNVHFHMLFLDGAYAVHGDDPPVFRPVPEPGTKDLQEILERIAARIGKALERRGVVERDIERAWLALDSEAGPMDDVLGHSITYRIAVGPRAGQKLFMLRTLPARPPEKDGVARTSGFTLHAGVGVAPGQSAKRERMCRYASRPPVAADRLALTPSGLVRYALKTPYRDGTTHIVLEPLDLMARLAALVPPPRTHLTRYHGVFAPRSKLRAAVTPAHRGVGAARQPGPGAEEKPPMPPHVAMNWARRLKRVFGIEIETCAGCGGKLRIIASIEEPQVIAGILSHLERTACDREQSQLPLGARAPPSQPKLL